MRNKGKEMKENFIKKLRCILIAVITAGIFLTACGSRVEEEAEQESQPEEQDELQAETQSEIQAEFQTESQPEPELKMDHDNWAQAYLTVAHKKYFYHNAKTPLFPVFSRLVAIFIVLDSKHFFSNCHVFSYVFLCKSGKMSGK